MLLSVLTACCLLLAQGEDERVAQWVLARRGLCSIDTSDGRFLNVPDRSELPNEPFRVTVVGLDATSVVDIGPLAEARHLEHLDLNDLQLTSSGAKVVSSLQQLGYLGIVNEQESTVTVEHTVPGPWTTEAELVRVRIGRGLLSWLARGRQLARLTITGKLMEGASLSELAGASALTELELHEFADADVAVLPRLPQLTALTLTGDDLTDACISAVLRQSQLKSLTVGADITDASLFEITSLPDLKSLAVGSDKITDRGGILLEQCRALEKLSLNGCPVGDATAATIGRLGTLRELSMGGTRLTDRGMAQLKGLKRLRTLVVSRTRVTNAMIPDIAEMESLEILYMGDDGVCVVDGDMEYLARLQRLKELSMGRAVLTEAGVRAIQGMKELKILVASMPLSDDVVEALGKCTQLRRLVVLGVPSTSESEGWLKSLRERLVGSDVRFLFVLLPPVQK